MRSAALLMFGSFGASERRKAALSSATVPYRAVLRPKHCVRENVPL